MNNVVNAVARPQRAENASTRPAEMEGVVMGVGLFEINHQTSAVKTAHGSIGHSLNLAYLQVG